MSRSLRRSPAIALVAVLALTLAACGVTEADSSSPGPGRQVETEGGEGGGDGPVVIAEGTFEGTGGAVFLSEAAEATSAVSTQRMTLTMTMTGVPMMGELEITAEGAFDNDAEQGTMTMDMGSMFEEMEGLGLPAGSGTIDMVFDGDVVYLRSPLFSMFSNDDRPWVEVPADELSGDQGGGFTNGAEDPGAFLEFLRNVGGEVTEVGTEEIRGVETVHVRTDLDLLAMLEEADPDQRAEMEEALESLGAAADSFRTLPAEAWIDAEGYVRKFTMSFDFSETDVSELGDTQMTVTVELYDFDEPVDVQIPDPSEVGTIDPSVFSGGF